MKKLILTSLLSVVAAGGLMAQGYVNWSAFSGAFFVVSTNDATYSPYFGGGATSIPGATSGLTSTAANGFYCELLYTNSASAQTAPTSFSALTGWSDSGLKGVNATGGAGNFGGSPANASATVPWINGTTKDSMVVIWSANLGTTWSTALATLQSPTALGNVTGQAYFGETATGLINPNASTPGKTIFSASVINAGSTTIYLVPVPEPGTMALAALGGASLLLFRRRK